jgi:hypothetical protein
VPETKTCSTLSTQKDAPAGATVQAVAACLQHGVAREQIETVNFDP